MYAQKNYLEIQGIKHPTKKNYRISQIGCFLTSFCNLLERFGKGVDPLMLNAFFRDHGVYIDVDDGIRDDLNYGAISRYNSNIVMSRSGTGAPKTNNCIVKFSGLESRFGTHFCLVVDASKGLILDSLDGKVKSWNDYGGPKTWAEYVDNTPPPPPPPPPAPVPVEVAPAPASDTINIKVASGWGLSHVLKAAGYTKEQWENPLEWQRLSALNNAPNGLKLRPNQIVKVYKTPLAIAPPAPAPAPAPEPAPTPPVVAEVPTLVEPVKSPEPEKPVEENKIDLTLIPSDPKAYQTTFTPEDKIYIAKKTTDVFDADGLHIPKRLVKGQRVTSGGIFHKKNENGELITYVRTAKSIASNVWYGIPLDVLTDGQNSQSYVGPLGNEPDEDNDFNLDVAKEMRELAGHFSSREKLVALIGKIQGIFEKIVSKIKNKG